jgi:hypothetical protein
MESGWRIWRVFRKERARVRNVLWGRRAESVPRTRPSRQDDGTTRVVPVLNSGNRDENVGAPTSTRMTCGATSSESMETPGVEWRNRRHVVGDQASWLWSLGSDRLAIDASGQGHRQERPARSERAD